MTHGGRSSGASSSCTTGKAPTVPQKCISKASSGKKRKRLKTTINTEELESLIYHESASAFKQELPPLLYPVAEPKQIKLYG